MKPNAESRRANYSTKEDVTGWGRRPKSWTTRGVSWTNRTSASGRGRHFREIKINQWRNLAPSKLETLTVKKQRSWRTEPRQRTNWTKVEALNRIYWSFLKIPVNQYLKEQESESTPKETEEETSNQRCIEESYPGAIAEEGIRRTQREQEKLLRNNTRSKEKKQKQNQNIQNRITNSFNRISGKWWRNEGVIFESWETAPAGEGNAENIK